MKEGNAAWQALEDDEAPIPFIPAVYNMAWRERHKKLGLCSECIQPASPGKSRCEKHLAYERKRQEKYREKRAEYMRRKRLDPVYLEAEKNRKR